MRRIASAALVTAIAASGLVAVAAPSQAATVHPMGCVDAGVHYSFSKAKMVWRPTNIYSPWGRKGFTFSYTTSKTGTWSATGTATVGAEAGVIFAKASTSFSLAIGKTWSHTSSWGVSGTISSLPRGKTQGRTMMYHKAEQFTTKKYTVNHTCSKTTVNWTKTFVAPYRSSDNSTYLWGYQYK
ncbi:hypothetical protein ABUW04_14300 [Streptacidiphilus sp. N1-10]|uniref:Uncharacterized protein n=1 Tax=Streptacidiphilus jeojiensis TaxID=3229225 RepID=A0ABV6XMK5_9ACTN